MSANIFRVVHAIWVRYLFSEIGAYNKSMGKNSKNMNP
jgi:hypothetical protein